MKMWHHRPTAGVGIATGDGLVVIDLDVKNGTDGIAAWSDWAEAHGVAWTPTTDTLSGGQHIYWRATDEFRNSASKIMNAVDVRGHHGYVIAYGSVPSLEELPELPEPVSKILRGSKPVDEASRSVGSEGVRAAVDAEVFNVTVAPEGMRNDTLNTAAYNLGQLVGPHLTREDAWERLYEAAHENDMDDEDDMVLGTLESGLDAGMANPRDTTTETSKSPSTFDAEVEQEARKLRIREAARNLVVRERLGEQAIAKPISLTDFLAVEDDEATYRVDGLWPTNGRVLLAANNKAGKTTLTGNLVRSLVDGDPFLGQFTVQRASRVVLLDNELAPNMIRRWLRDQSIGTTDAVEVVSLRGQLSTFNLLDPVVRTLWARSLRSADVLIFDCLRPVLDALGLSEDKEAGRFLEALDELIAEAGIKELVVVHHMGHSNERARGDSRILDWPDAVWKLVREDPDCETSPRYMSAYGRDVEMRETQLLFDSTNRHLTLGDGNRHEAQSASLEISVEAYVTSNEGCTKADVENAVVGKNDAIRAAVKTLVARNVLRIASQAGSRAHCLYLQQAGGDFDVVTD